MKSQGVLPTNMPDLVQKSDLSIDGQSNTAALKEKLALHTEWH